MIIGVSQLTFAQDCTDSDDGKNYYIKGTLSSSGGESFTDYCQTDVRLNEMYCVDKNSYSSVEFDCPNGCKGGVCVEETGKGCTDSDGGINYYVKGTARGIGQKGEAQTGEYTDFCTSTGTIYERYCTEDNTVGYIITACKNSVCKDGACVEKTKIKLAPNAFIIEYNETMINQLKIDGPIILTKKFYEQYRDKYDFIGFHFLNGVLGESTYSFTALGNFEQGAFFNPPTDMVYLPSKDQVINTSEAFGTEKLIGGYVDSFNFFDQYADNFKNDLPWAMINNIYFELIFHELTHLWGVLLPQELEEAYVYNGDNYEGGHWESFTGSWVSVDVNPMWRYYQGNDGKFYFVMNCGTEPRQNVFDLYSMGLESSEEITERLVIHNNPGQIVASKCDTPVEVPKEKIRKVLDIQHLIDVLGPRVPSYKDSQKDFTMAFVLFVPQRTKINEEIITAFNMIAENFPIVWYKSTKKRSTLNKVIPEDLVPPTISNFQILPGNTIKWTTNEPAIGFVIYEKWPGSDRIYPETIKRPYKYSTTHAINLPNDKKGNKIIVIDKSYNLASFDISENISDYSGIASNICSGCLKDDKCYPLGYRKNRQYCSENNKFETQKNKESNCENNFECESNVCVNDKCISPNLIQKIIDWFIRLFG